MPSTDNATSGQPAAPPLPDHGAISVRRFVNDKIAETAARLDPGNRSDFEFFCECGSLSCRALVRLTLAEYAATAPGSIVAHLRLVEAR